MPDLFALQRVLLSTYHNQNRGVLCSFPWLRPSLLLYLKQGTPTQWVKDVRNDTEQANISLLNYANFMLRLVLLSAVTFENGAVTSGCLWGWLGSCRHKAGLTSLGQ